MIFNMGSAVVSLKIIMVSAAGRLRTVEIKKYLK